MAEALKTKLADELVAGLQAMVNAGCLKAGLVADQACQARLLAHLEALDRWRGRLNLTGEMTPAEMVQKHTLDSLAVLPWVKGEHLLDIGTGAGFPGLTLASARPDWAVTLLDSRGKRIEFIRYVLAQLHGELALPRVELVHSRIEQFLPMSQQIDGAQANAAAEGSKTGSIEGGLTPTSGKRKFDDDQAGISGKNRPADVIGDSINPTSGGIFDTLVARAVSSLENLLTMTQHLHAPGLRVLAMKGQYPAEELAAVETGWPQLAVDVVPLRVPGVEAARHVVIMDFQP